MKVFPIDTFKYGLDTRRDALTSQPGTLYTLENGHINPGGEIEKRKAFIEYADLTIFDNVAASITSLTRSSTTATATTLVAHGLSTGEWVKISGAAQSDYNVERQVTVTGTSTFTFSVSNSPVTPATGTIVFGDLGIFGLEVTDSGLLVFGSAVANGGSSSQGEPILESAMPTGITYQQLKHPSIYNDTTETYVRTRHRMTQVVFSLNRNGKAFVCAQFSDSRRFLYYDGALVQHSANGIVMTGRTDLADLGNDLYRQLVAVGWTGDANEDESGATENGSVMVKSPATDYFTALPEETSSLGQIGVKFVTQDTAAGNGTLARAGFQIAGILGTFKLIIYQDATSTILVPDLTGGAIQGVTDIATTCAKIARAVNDLSYVHGYTALTNAVVSPPTAANSVYIYAPLNGDVVGTALSLQVDYSVAGEVIAVGAVPTTMSVTGEKLSRTGEYFDLAVAGPWRPSAGTMIYADVICYVQGGTAPYTYTWFNSQVSQRIILHEGINNHKASVKMDAFSFFAFDGGQLVPKGTDKSATVTFTCRVTDSVGLEVTLSLPVQLVFAVV